MAELSKLRTAVEWHVWLPVEILFKFLWRADMFCIGYMIADYVIEGTDNTLFILNWNPSHGAGADLRFDAKVQQPC
jgi:hypothetical protein